VVFFCIFFFHFKGILKLVLTYIFYFHFGAKMVGCVFYLTSVTFDQLGIISHCTTIVTSMSIQLISVNLEIDIVVKTLIWDIFSLSTYFSNTWQYIKHLLFSKFRFLLVLFLINTSVNCNRQPKTPAE
jgi:hypothetical protein